MIKTIIALGALIGAISGAAHGKANAVSSAQIELYAEIAFLCERLEISDKRCVTCNEFSDRHKASCLTLKEQVANQYRLFEENPVLGVLQSELALTLSGSEHSQVQRRIVIVE